MGGIAGKDKANGRLALPRPGCRGQLLRIHHEAPGRKAYHVVRIAVAGGAVLPQHPGGLAAGLVTRGGMIGKADTQPRWYRIRVDLSDAGIAVLGAADPEQPAPARTGGE